MSNPVIDVVFDDKDSEVVSTFLVHRSNIFAFLPGIVQLLYRSNELLLDMDQRKTSGIRIEETALAMILFF